MSNINIQEEKNIQIELKICNACGEEKKIIDYYRYKNSMSGICKKCNIKRKMVNYKYKTNIHKLQPAFNVLKQIHENEPHILEKYNYKFEELKN